MSGVLDAFRLDGRVAVVTGGSRGIGAALVVALREAGADVVVASRSEGVITDVTDVDSVRAMAAEIGRIDVLVNNAGVCYHRPALEVPDEEWRSVWEVNVDGVWNCSRVVGEQMIARGGGVIVNIGSISAMIVNRPQWQPAYNASKAGVHHLTKSLAAEWAAHGVRVNAVAPGYVRTEMAPVDRPEFAAQWIGDTPQQRAAEPEEIAPAVVFLASRASSFMTGTVLVIDGGYTVF